jgi:ribosomal protein L40E
MAEIEHTTVPRSHSRGKKYYRVILSGIDPSKETPDTFALKLSIQTRALITRINSIVRNLPAPIKSGLDVSQARKFAAVIEELGGKTKIESYFLHPGESHSRRGEHRDRRYPHSAMNPKGTKPTSHAKSGGIKVCISCGWENAEDAANCEFCHRKFEPDEPPDPLQFKEQAPEENPLAKAESKSQDLTLWDYIARHKIAFLVGLNVFLILFLIFRR